MRKAAAALCVLFMAAGAIWLLALPAPAGVNPYPPIVTTTTTVSPTTTTSSPTPTTAPSGTTTTTQAGPQVITVTPSKLAFTGSDSKPYVIAGIIAVTVGAMAIVATRRRSAVRARKLDS